MATVNIHEAKTHLSRLLERASQGERIIIAKAGKPIAELGPLTPGRTIVFGSHEGELDIDWDALEAADEEMDEEMARMFYGEAGG
jgi:prevent-host-death family protein